jgi:hypothetical protein
MTKPDNKKPQNGWRGWLAISPLFIFQFCLFGLMGFLFDSSNRLSGFLWGFGIGLGILIISAIGFFVWEWIKKGADKGNLLPYLLVGFVVAIAISGTLAINLGTPSCDDQGDAPYSSCVSYANDGFETTSSQKWDKFWHTLPVTVIITSLIAVIVRNEVHKRQK